MKRNQPGKWIVYAYGSDAHGSPGIPVTGDAANITANLRLDGGIANPVDDTNPTELEDGFYVFDITAAENNADMVLIAPASATANVLVKGCPRVIYPTTGMYASFVGTADSGGTTSFVDAALGQADTDYWVGNWVRFTSGSIAGQVRVITGFAPGTDTITFAPATTQAVGTNTYEIVPSGGVDVELWKGADAGALLDVTDFFSDGQALNTNAGVVESNTKQLNGDAAAAARIALSAFQIVPGTVDTVTNTHTPTTTEFQADDVLEATVDHYKGRLVIFTSGVLLGQQAKITGYTQVGGIGQFTVELMTDAPSNNDTFILI